MKTFIATNYISKKEFDKLSSTCEVNIIGFTKLEKFNENKHKDLMSVSYTNKNKENRYVVYKDLSGSTKGYFKVTATSYIAVRRKKPILLLLLLILLLLVLGFIFLRPDRGNKIVLENGVEIDLDKQPTVEGKPGIAVPGLGVEYVLTEKNKTFNLINPENNTVYFKYTVKEGDTVIYTTDWITPNQMVQLDLWSLLDAGQHNIVVHLDTLDVITEEACTTSDLSTIVTVKK